MALTHAQIEAIRARRGRSMLLFITDRCPVGCAHCSVDARADSPMIRDFELFDRIVAWLAARPELEVVGISGGEPFVERRGLEIASEQLTAAGKRLVVFTSGVWAVESGTPEWIEDVLGRCDSVYLSTDGFHAAAIDEAKLLRALRCLAALGVWTVLQVLDHEAAHTHALALLEQALGSDWDRHAEINLVPPLTHGRGATQFTRLARSEGHTLPRCSLVRSPMVRYDGTFTACCNESVIMGGGPQRLRRQARSTDDMHTTVEQFHRDSLLRVIGDVGLGVLTCHPRFEDLARQRFTDNCELCWQLMERMPEGSDRLIDAVAALQRDHDVP